MYLFECLTEDKASDSYCEYYSCDPDCAPEQVPSCSPDDINCSPNGCDSDTWAEDLGIEVEDCCSPDLFD